jgi:hypothetical protein
MNEAEYVETLREAAQGYIDEIADPSVPGVNAREAIDRWWAVRDKMSARMMLSLCDAWLEKEGADG